MVAKEMTRREFHKKYAPELRMLNTGTGREKAAALGQLAKTGEREAVHHIGKLLRTGKGGQFHDADLMFVAHEALMKLRHIDNKGVAKSIKKLATHDDRYVRMQVARNSWRLGENGKRILKKLERDKDVRVRVDAKESLKLLKSFYSMKKEIEPKR